MKRNTWIALTVAGLIAAGVLAWAFAPRPVEVELGLASVGPFETAVEEDGRTRVRDRHGVAAPIAGRLRRMTLREGDRVKVGDALAQIEPMLTPLLDERSRREQQARAAAMQAALERARTRVRSSEIGVEQALNERRRTAQLVTEGFVSPAKADADRLALEAALRERDAAQDSERVARHELAQARVALDLADARPVGAGPATSVFTVRAPVAATVLKVHLPSEGVVALGAPLLDIADTERIEVVAELLTSDAALARPGAAVRLERWGGPGTLQGRVRRIEPAAFTKVSALGVEEQRVNVLIDLMNAGDAAGLGDGWRVSVRIVTRREDAVLRVPVSAVFPLPAGGPGGADGSPSSPQGDPMGVFVVDGGRARLTVVEVGARNGSLAWIRSGLSPGQAVIAYPPPAVAEGVRVRSRRP